MTVTSGLAGDLNAHALGRTFHSATPNDELVRDGQISAIQHITICGATITVVTVSMPNGRDAITFRLPADTANVSVT